jgi:hypothetical protein
MDRQSTLFVWQPGHKAICAREEWVNTESTVTRAVKPANGTFSGAIVNIALSDPATIEVS